MPAPDITALPPAPLRSQSPSNFTTTAEAFVAALPGLVSEINAFGAWAEAFEAGGGATVTISETAPVDPAAGDMWWDSEAGRLKVYYDDGTSAQWVDASPLGAWAPKRGFSFQIVGSAPAADELLAIWTPPSGETVTFADDFVGCVGKKISGGTDPAAAYSLVVKKNGTNVGTITISDAGVVSFATSGTTVVLIGGTDTLEIYGAATPDAATGFAFTMAGDL